MSMPAHRPLRTATLRSGAYDPSESVLEIDFNDGRRIRYRSVPAEVARRFFASPNPASFWEDRIADEYAFESGRATAGEAEAKRRLDDLFGKD
ncbi:MAG: KTSC domain-containing protein [Lautropia sp.]